MKEIIIVKKGPCLDDSSFFIMKNNLYCLTKNLSVYRIDQTLDLTSSEKVLQKEVFIYKFDTCIHPDALVVFDNKLLLAYHQDQIDRGLIKIFEMFKKHSGDAEYESMQDTSIELNFFGLKFGIQLDQQQVQLWVKNEEKDVFKTCNVCIEDLINGEVVMSNLEFIEKSKKNSEKEEFNKYIKLNNTKQYLDLIFTQTARNQLHVHSWDFRLNFQLNGTQSGLLSLKETKTGFNFSDRKTGLLHVLFPYVGYNSALKFNICNIGQQSKGEECTKELILKNEYFKNLSVIKIRLKEVLAFTETLVTENMDSIDLDDLNNDIKNVKNFC